MRRDNSALIRMDVWVAVLFAQTILGVYHASAQSDGVELILDRSPLNGGLVTPGTGVHRFAAHADVTISAVPQQGYRFAYWLGDVGDPTSSTTSIRMGSSKAVVAVFEPVQDDALLGQEHEVIVEAPPRAGGGGSGLVYAVNGFWVGGPISVGGGGKARGGRTTVVEFPSAPVPEPATLTLMGLGAAILRQAPWTRSGRSRDRSLTQTNRGSRPRRNG